MGVGRLYRLSLPWWGFCVCRFLWRQCQHPCSVCWRGRRRLCTSRVTSPTDHSVYLVRVVWRTVGLPQPSLPLHGDVLHSKDILWWYIRLCFYLLSVIIGRFVCKDQCRDEVPARDKSEHLNRGACRQHTDISGGGPTHTVCFHFCSVSSGHFPNPAVVTFLPV
jgi:hypothetical protein